MEYTAAYQPISLLLWSSFFFTLFLITTYYARNKRFLLLPLKNYSGTSIQGKDVFSALIIFIISFSIVSQLMLRSIYTMVVNLINTHSLHSLSPDILTFTIVPIISSLIYISLMTIYSLTSRSFIPKSLIKDRTFPYTLTFLQDFLVGLKVLVLSFFPLLSIMNFMEALSQILSNSQPIDQDAVKFLLSAKQHPLTFSFAFISIVIAAPIIEEFLFRGVIQTFLRKKYRSILAIIFTSGIFSLFHFSISQGVSNIPILISLYVLSVYLGFAYEKTRSLISSITLHVTFNLINVIKIFFYEV